MKTSVFFALFASTVPVMSQVDRLDQTLDEVKDRLSKVDWRRQINEVMDTLDPKIKSGPGTVRTAEEEGYLDVFGPLHQATRESAASIVMGEPAERLAALEKLKETHEGWYASLQVTLPPDSMLEPGLNVREQILKLLEKSTQVGKAEELTDLCVTFLRTRADYNGMLKAREVVKDDGARYETRYAFRPLGNPLMIYTGNGSFTGGEFKVSVMIPTPAGGLTVWRQAKGSSLRHLVVEYNGTSRVFSIRDGLEFSIEDPKMYAVTTAVHGDRIILTVATRGGGASPPAKRPAQPVPAP